MAADAEKKKQKTSAGPRRHLMLTLRAWVFGLLWFAAYIAVRAQNETVFDPLFWPIVGPVWALCLCALVVSILRLTAGWRSLLLRIAAVVICTTVQCYASYLPLFLIAVYVHLWAGGNL